MEKLKLGMIVSLDADPENTMNRVRNMGFPTCQIGGRASYYNQEIAQKLKVAMETTGVEITSLWPGLPGRHVWNFVDGPSTIGLVPPETREARLEALKQASDFAHMVGIQSIATHVGFIPENPADPVYKSVVEVLKDVVRNCAKNNQSFLFETGQETPITLLRTIEDVGADNLGVNFDPANLLMYGKANPIDALDIIGTYVRGVHAKDGEYPTNGRELGKEKPIGEGRVNFPVFVPRLKSLGYRGTLTIEREISGPQQIEDIKKARIFLEKLC